MSPRTFLFAGKAAPAYRFAKLVIKFLNNLAVTVDGDPAVRDRLNEAGIRVVQTPFQAPNANAHAERFVRSIKEECLHRMIPLGERHFRRAVTEFVTQS